MAQADPFPGPHEEGLVALAFREEGIRHLALERGKVFRRVENPHRFRLGTIEAENDVVARRREKDEGDVSKKEARTRDRWIGKLGERTEGLAQLELRRIPRTEVVIDLAIGKNNDERVSAIRNQQGIYRHPRT